MRLTDVFLTLGSESFSQLLRSVSMGKLKTYQLFDRIKTRTHLSKLSAETLHKASGRLWTRISEHDEELARDLSQAILVCHLGMIVEVLNFLGIPHQDGFFEKDLDAKPYLTDGWIDRVLEKFKPTYPEAVLRFYTAHLDWEMNAAK